MHDKCLNRTTNGKGLIKKTKSEKIFKLYLNDKSVNGSRKEKVPTLEDAIKIINGLSKLVIDVKLGSDYYPGIENQIISVIKKHNAEKWCIIHSYKNSILEQFHRLDPDIELHKILFFVFSPQKIRKSSFIEKYNYVSEFSVFYFFLNTYVINEIHRINKKVNVWTVNDKKSIEKFCKMGVDGIITDYPEFLKK
jgi:glycerophosphoryl diester phosphodiesterase